MKEKPPEENEKNESGMKGREFINGKHALHRYATAREIEPNKRKNARCCRIEKKLRK
jgi:hypothetical protein